MRRRHDLVETVRRFVGKRRTGSPADAEAEALREYAQQAQPPHRQAEQRPSSSRTTR